MNRGHVSSHSPHLAVSTVLLALQVCSAVCPVAQDGGSTVGDRGAQLQGHGWPAVCQWCEKLAEAVSSGEAARGSGSSASTLGWRWCLLGLHAGALHCFLLSSLPWTRLWVMGSAGFPAHGALLPAQGRPLLALWPVQPTTPHLFPGPITADSNSEGDLKVS